MHVLPEESSIALIVLPAESSLSFFQEFFLQNFIGFSPTQP